MLPASQANWFHDVLMLSWKFAPGAFCHQGRSMPCFMASAVYGKEYLSSKALLLAASAILDAAYKTSKLLACGSDALSSCIISSYVCAA